MRILSTLILTCGFLLAYSQEVLKTSDAQIDFVSDAPLELISATSIECEGVMDIDSRSFAFRVKIRTFEGFNSPLQKEHFNENYLESEKFSHATFNGRILDGVDLRAAGEYNVEVKGKLEIHGVTQERVIAIRLEIDDEQVISFNSDFVIDLDAHRIEVPRIVQQKISEHIRVTVKGKLS